MCANWCFDIAAMPTDLTISNELCSSGRCNSFRAYNCNHAERDRYRRTYGGVQPHVVACRIVRVEGDRRSWRYWHWHTYQLRTLSRARMLNCVINRRVLNALSCAFSSGDTQFDRAHRPKLGTSCLHSINYLEHCARARSCVRVCCVCVPHRWV